MFPCRGGRGPEAAAYLSGFTVQFVSAPVDCRAATYAASDML